MVTAIFLDTMLFQQYRFPDEIDWPHLVEAPEVELIIAPVVMRQLNRHKDAGTNPRLRKRAAEVLARLGRLFADGPVAELRQGVTLRYLPREPQLDFAAHGLARDIEDDHLVAGVLAFREQHEGRSVLLGTTDVGLRLKVAEHRIAAVAPPDNQKLPDEPDPNERRVQELERELRELRQGVPVLKLGFVDGSGHVRFVLSPPPVPAEETIARQVALVRQKYPHMSIPPASQSGLAFLSPDYVPDDEIVAYNKRLDRYYREFEQYLRVLIRYEGLRHRTLQLNLLLRNEGNGPAQDIDVFLRFPVGCEVVDKESLPAKPEAPALPPGPRKRFDAMLPDVSGLASLAANRAGLPLLKSLQIRRDSAGYEVRFHADRLKQYLSEPIERLYVLFASYEAAASFGIDYRINAANLTHEGQGHLGVVITQAGQAGAED